MKNILTSLFATAITVASFATTVNYTADNSTNFTNPERGFYEQVEQKVTNSTSSNLNDYYFTNAEAAGRSLILRLYYLDNFRTQALPDNVLTLFSNDMAVFRTKGAKCILRFAYTNSSAKPYQDASPAIWQQHLSQLKPILQANADVIYVVQAGFLGVWGEWYYSSQGTGDAIPQSVRTALINQLLDAVPVSRCVQLRTPQYKTEYIGDATPLSATTAWQQNQRARLGHHNDAFCNGAENMGTYRNITTDKAYIAQECLYVPNGGETNIEESDAYNNYGTGAKALAEMKLLHYSYLNYDYSDYATDRWKTEQDAEGNAYYDLMARHMGYRYQLLQGTFPAEVETNGTLSLTLSVKNVGFAPLYNERHAYIVLKSATNTYSIQLQSDPRTWAPDQTTTIQETLTLPADIQSGTYSLHLYLPDAASRLAANPKYAVRCANTDTWDAATGYNNLNASLQITDSATPDPAETVTITYSDNQPAAWHKNFLLTPSGNTTATIDKGTNYTVPTGTPSIGVKTEPDYLIYIFQGWNTEQDGTGTTYMANDVIPSVTTDITLYAQWEGRPFPITYYADQAKTEQLNLLPDSYTFVTKVIFPIPSRLGYDFVAWHSTWNSTVVTSTEGYYGDFGLYAEWKASTPTELTTAESNANNTCKYIQNGTLFIQRNNITYTILGTQLTK